MKTTLITLLAAASIGLSVDDHRPPTSERAPSPASAEDSTRLPDALQGRYRFAGGDAERAALASSIDAVVEQMSPLVEGVARRKLEEATRIAPTVEIGERGPDVTVRHAAHLFAAPLQGPPVETTDVMGEQVRLVHRLRGDRLVETFRRDNGYQRVQLSRSGETLTFEGAIVSGRLPAEVHYRLTYERR